MPAVRKTQEPSAQGRLQWATAPSSRPECSAAMAKVINCGSNCGALVFFAATGNVLWPIGAVMACANIAGSVVGSRMALRKGSSFVRIVLLVVVVAMAIRLGWQQFG